MTSMEHNSLKDAMDRNHAENREDIQRADTRLCKMEDSLSTMRENQTRMIAIQESMNNQMKRTSFIVEGDGNGNPGLAKTFDKMSNNLDLIKRMLAWGLPILISLAIGIIGNPYLRHLVLHIAVLDTPSIREALPITGDAAAPYAPK